ALAAATLISPALITLAHRLGWVEQPRPDRWSQRPTALMGGIALYVATLAGAAATGAIHHGTAALWVGATAMFLLGLADDRLHIRPHVKLVGQIAAACWLILSGIYFTRMPLYLALPVTVLWVIGITNAVNLLDNMDGLAAGVAGIGALVISSFGLQSGTSAVAELALPLAGACAGFLIFNFRPARIFMGDCGSMFLGFTLAGA